MKTKLLACISCLLVVLGSVFFPTGPAIAAEAQPSFYSGAGTGQGADSKATAEQSRGAAKADRRSSDFAEPMVGMTVNNVWEPNFWNWGAAIAADPWVLVKDHTPEREPELGWYNQRDLGAFPDVAEQQLAWMADYGIDYVSYLWLWNPSGKSKSEPSIDTYLAAPSHKDLAFALLWDYNEVIRDRNASASGGVPKDDLTMALWPRIVNRWLEQYMSRSEYLRIDNQPVVYMHGTASSRLIPWAKDQAEERYPGPEYVRDGITYYADLDGHPGGRGKYLLVLQDLNAIADELARERGFDGLFLVSGFGNNTAHWNMVSLVGGFDAESPYNYHSAPTWNTTKEIYSESYEELAGFYKRQWYSGLEDYFPDNRNPQEVQKRIVPMTAGWNQTPLTENRRSANLVVTAEEAHNGSYPNDPKEFEDHLRQARKFMADYPDTTLGLGKIYAWNEFMEGGIVEPIAKSASKMAYLEAISRVFGKLETSVDQWKASPDGATLAIGVETDLRTWTIESPVPGWLTASPKSGRYSGKLSVSAAPNTTGQERTAWITVRAGGLTSEIKVTQAGAAATLSVSPSSWSAPAAAASLNVTVTTNQSQWTATSNQSWLTVSPASGKNSGQVTLKVTANTTTASRIGTVTFSAGNKTVTFRVTQAGATTLELSSASWHHPVSRAGSWGVTVTTNQSQWTAVSSAKWLTVTRTPSGQALLQMTENTSTAKRTGTVTFSAGGKTATVAVTQVGKVNTK
ncbi:MAG: hypothetical protein LBE06_09255 [Azoarcus sp.]|nr:hypothetical protein [Azoarcus sp.]